MSFLQGRTTRWGVGWCFEDERIQDAAIRTAVNRQVAMGNQKAKKLQGRGSDQTQIFRVPLEENSSSSVIRPRLVDLVNDWKRRGMQVNAQEKNSNRVDMKLILENEKKIVINLELSITWKMSNEDSGSVDIVAVTLVSANPEGPG
eukprot:CAMPEP_0167747556 /NCGR_PEP_ID=MMETSP0110_2-20121227/4351_1 /TAXON_ID=629695 /ORGANISM="Gymnochlora sp., Strain CCMP2014" /LENGTH=145 /DNA_ID=CAMNT_0007632479 /DNA_START=231 /DNA_END=664 /DNA_ORIENTATION=+